MTLKRFTIGDEIEAITNMLNFSRPTFSYLRGEFYDPEEFDLVPKKNYIERKIKEKEEDLTRLKQRRENEQRAYDNQEKSINLEIEMLKQKLSG